MWQRLQVDFLSAIGDCEIFVNFRFKLYSPAASRHRWHDTFLLLFSKVPIPVYTPGVPEEAKEWEIFCVGITRLCTVKYNLYFTARS